MSQQVDDATSNRICCCWRSHFTGSLERSGARNALEWPRATRPPVEACEPRRISRARRLRRIAACALPTILRTERRPSASLFPFRPPRPPSADLAPEFELPQRNERPHPPRLARDSGEIASALARPLRLLNGKSAQQGERQRAQGARALSVNIWRSHEQHQLVVIVRLSACACVCESCACLNRSPEEKISRCKVTKSSLHPRPATSISTRPARKKKHESPTPQEARAVARPPDRTWRI